MVAADQGSAQALTASGLLAGVNRRSRRSSYLRPRPAATTISSARRAARAPRFSSGSPRRCAMRAGRPVCGWPSRPTRSRSVCWRASSPSPGPGSTRRCGSRPSGPCVAVRAASPCRPAAARGVRAHRSQRLLSSAGTRAGTGCGTRAGGRGRRHRGGPAMRWATGPGSTSTAPRPVLEFSEGTS